MKITFAVWLAIALMLVTAAATATPITFSMSTTGLGSLNGTAFGDNTLTITYVTDTLNIINNGTGPATVDPQGTIQIAISGIGGGTITGATFFYDDHTTGIMGITDEAIGFDLIDEANSVFDSYDMKTALGPINGVVSNSTALFANVATSAGLLTFLSNSTNATFQATGGLGVPEPGTFGLMIAGAALLAAVRSIVLVLQKRV